MVRMLLPSLDKKLELSLQIHEEKRKNPMEKLHEILAKYYGKTQINVNAKKDLFVKKIDLGLLKSRDGLRHHRMQEVCRFTEGGKKATPGKHFNIGTSEPKKCSCQYCSKAWVKAFFP